MNDTVKPIVVVADDDRDICELIKMQLTAEHKPAVALLDIMMPKLSGLEVAHQIRDNPHLSTVSIMLTSARSSGRLEADLEDLNIDDYITKPFSPQELVQRINNIINNPPNSN